MKYKHNIYLIKPTDDTFDKYIGYDCNDGHVVIADTEEEARKMCPISDEGDIWTRLDLTTCKKIGESNMEKQVVLVSFRAG